MSRKSTGLEVSSSVSLGLISFARPRTDSWSTGAYICDSCDFSCWFSLPCNESSLSLPPQAAGRSVCSCAGAGHGKSLTILSISTWSNPVFESYRQSFSVFLWFLANGRCARLGEENAAFLSGSPSWLPRGAWRDKDCCPPHLPHSSESPSPIPQLLELGMLHPPHLPPKA